MEKIIFTLGTSDRTAEGFFQLLLQHSIRRLMDVRRFPTSERFPHFSGCSLEGLAEERGVEVFYLGDLLGGYRRGGYVQHLQTTEFRAGLTRVEALATVARSAILCAERFPWRCHRRFIAAALEDRGWRVVHIIDAHRIWIPRRRDQDGENSARGQIELDLSG